MIASLTVSRDLFEMAERGAKENGLNVASIFYPFSVSLRK